VRDNEANASSNRPETRIRGTYEFYKLLSNYRKLTCFDDLVNVFPSAEKYNRKEETDTDFVLAMIALEEKPFIFTQLFGLDLLFEVISDPVRSENIKRLYDFDYKSFIDLTAKHDVFSREEVSTLWGTVNEREGQLAGINQALADRDGQIANLNQVVGERDQAIQTLIEQVAERDAAVAERDGQIAEIINSTSWKLTKPIRYIGRLVNKLK
jgi:methyl-accepting chemotaxis protein